MAWNEADEKTFISLLVPITNQSSLISTTIYQRTLKELFVSFLFYFLHHPYRCYSRVFTKIDDMELHHEKHEAVASAGGQTVQRHHLGDGMTLSGLRRAISQVSMLVVKATTSGESAWREECLKYAFSSLPSSSLPFFWFLSLPSTSTHLNKHRVILSLANLNNNST